MFELNLSLKIGELCLKNPVITASGTCGTGKELRDFYDINKLGAITVKGITIDPTEGNPVPRIAETASGILNAIGLENPGLNGFLDNELPVIRKYRVPVLVNISGYCLDDFAILAEKLNNYKEISGLEVNVSCPNIAGGGLAFGTDSEQVYKVSKRVKANYDGPVIVKLSPNVNDIVAIARAAEEGG